LTVDNMAFNGNTLTTTSSDFIVDASHDITLDAGGNDINVDTSGTRIAQFNTASNNFTLKSIVSDKDIIFLGNDGGSPITALTLDMSDLGSAFFNHDIILENDGAILKFGADHDVSLTHVHNVGLLLNSSSQLQFGDSGTFISQSADGVLDLVADTEIEINATDIDINGDVHISGSLGGISALNLGGPIITNGGNFIFNEDSADYDFRVESNGATHALFVDGGTNNVGIGANASNIPAATSNSSYKQLFVSTGGALVDSGGSGPSTQLLNNSYIGSGNNNYATATQVASRMNLTGGRIQFDTAPSVSADAQQTFTERLRIHTNGVASFNDGIALGVGTANTASNVLDDYEEGSFTATLTGHGAAPNTAVTTTGTYTKVGRQVSVYMDFNNKDTTGASGNIKVTGLPFSVSVSALGSYLSYGVVAYTANSINTATQFVAGDSYVQFMDNITSGAWENSTIVAGNTKYLYLSGTYYTS